MFSDFFRLFKSTSISQRTGQPLSIRTPAPQLSSPSHGSPKITPDHAVLHILGSGYQAARPAGRRSPCVNEQYRPSLFTACAYSQAADTLSETYRVPSD